MLPMILPNSPNPNVLTKNENNDKPNEQCEEQVVPSTEEQELSSNCQK
jgi:hypothetical protein